MGTWKRVYHLAKNNEIFFYCIGNSHEIENAGELVSICQDTRVYERSTGIMTILKSIFLPYPAVSRWNKDLKKDLAIYCDKYQPDIIMIDYPQMYGCIPEQLLKKYTIILNQHNIEHLALKSIAQNTNQKWKQLLYKVVEKQMFFYEKRLYHKGEIALYTFVSSEDKLYFENMYNKNNTLLVPAGAEVRSYKKIVNEKNIAFVAQFSYLPNEMAAMWFLDRCWETVKKEMQDVVLYLVGKKPTDRLKKRCEGDKQIVLTGTVDSLEPYYNSCNLVIVPVKNGGGVKIKLLEALGYGKVVVTTKESICGTEFQHQQHILVANSEDEFADFCIKILKNPKDYETIRRNGYEKILTTYSWEHIMANFESEIKGLMKNPK